MKSTKVLAVTALLLFLLPIVSACGSTNEEETTPAGPSEPDYATTITAQLLESLNTGDYETISGYFDTAMSVAMDEAKFEQLREQTVDVYGEFTSHEITAVQYEVQDIYTITVYDVTFADGTTYQMQVTYLETDDGAYLAGLFFK